MGTVLCVLADFDKAVPLDPSSPDLRNLQVCVRIWNAWLKKNSIDGEEVIKGFRPAECREQQI
jgi:hypothetical protein